MEQYIVSARKYRPSTFATVVGQTALTETLKNAIARDKLAHAYLFCGSRGVGKTSCARIFAKTINCAHRTPEGEACNECDSCREFNENRSLNILELDAASNNGVESMRDLIDRVMVPPTEGRYRVFIIDEVHMLSNQAFNAFLKTLEEPPAHAIFILATTEKHKILPTILSRCQIYDFKRITIPDMVDHMQMVARNEGATAEVAALNIIARKADGAMRDALSIFDQVLASSRGNITLASTLENLNVLDSAYYQRLVDAFRDKDVSRALLIYKEIRDRGFDSRFFINGLAQYMRDLMVASDPATMVLLDAPEEVRLEMAENASRLTPDFLYRAMDICNDADFNYRASSNKQLLIELALIRLCQRLSPSARRSGHVEGLLQALNAPTKASVKAPAGTIGASAPAVAPARPAAPAPEPARSRPAAAVPRSSREAVPAPRRAVPGSERLAPAPRLHGPAPVQKVSSPVSEQTPEIHDADFTDEQFQQAWRDFIEQHPESHILINAMRTARLEGSGTRRKVVTDAAMGVKILSDDMPRILAHLRGALNNSSVEIEIECVEGENSPRMWTSNQVLEHWLRTKPDLRDFIEEYKLRLL